MTATMSLYDGRERLGDIVAREKGFDAFTAKGRRLGNFASVKLACNAISACRTSGGEMFALCEDLSAGRKRRG